ncbi:MAG: hypothetical protein KIT09_14470 [Bryobacteraceae bacterium]|nr:hypothetical protein [Bryobacteraceae bacterium]
MTLEFQLEPRLPRLAWAAALRQGTGVVRIIHGPWVETREGGFFEGAWNGPFEEGHFDRAEVFAGSGGRLQNREIVFAGPNHIYEQLLSVRAGDRLFVSNSLAFLLTISGERLDPEYPRYYLDLLDFHRAGIRVKQKRLRLLGSRSVELHDCCNLRVRRDLTASRLEKPLGPPPRDFGDYISFLDATVARVFANAHHPERKRAYRPVTMVSQGYDSTAVSALAARAGCREAVTFHRSNSRKGYIDDNGSALAASLGLRVTEYERTDFRSLPRDRHDEFYIEPWGGDRVLLLMERQLEGALLLTGRFGDNLWHRGGRPRWGIPGANGLPDLQHPADSLMSGSSLGEFRLRTGFVHFPPAAARGLHAPAIHAIADSVAMRPWSVGGSYDKPVARRIAEEAGVPRRLFGQFKRGGPAHTTPPLRGLCEWPPLKILALRLFGNRFHPAWRAGSFGVQRGVERTIERYLEAMSVPRSLSRAATSR